MTRLNEFEIKFGDIKAVAPTVDCQFPDYDIRLTKAFNWFELVEKSPAATGQGSSTMMKLKILKENGAKLSNEHEKRLYETFNSEEKDGDKTNKRKYKKKPSPQFTENCIEVGSKLDDVLDRVIQGKPGNLSKLEIDESLSLKDREILIKDFQKELDFVESEENPNPKIVKILKNIIEFLNGVAVKRRQYNRKKKEKSAKEQVKLVDVLSKFELDGIEYQGEPVTKLVGATFAVAYDTDKRFIWVYESETKDGFGIHRTALSNVDAKKSYKKKLRKPAEVVPMVKNKTAGLKIIKGVKAKEQPLNTTRTNSNMVFLVIK